MLKAAGDAQRLSILARLMHGALQVSDIAAATDAGLSTTSQRLKLLLAEGLVTRERQGRNVSYRLADAHVRDLIASVLEHADPDHLESMHEDTHEDTHDHTHEGDTP